MSEKIKKWRMDRHKNGHKYDLIVLTDEQKEAKRRKEMQDAKVRSK